MSRLVGRRSARRFDDDVVHDEAAVAAELETEAAVRQVGGGQFQRPFFRQPIDNLFEFELLAVEIRDAHTKVAARRVPAFANVPAMSLIGTGIIEMHRRSARRIAVDQDVAAGRRAVVVEVVQCEEECDPLGRLVVGTDFVVEQIEGRLNPFPWFVRRPIERAFGRDPFVATRSAFDDPQRAVRADGGGSFRLRLGSHRECHGTGPARSIIAWRGVRPVREKRRVGAVEVVREQDACHRSMLAHPASELDPQRGRTSLRFALLSLPRFNFARERGMCESLVRLEPFLHVEDRVQIGLQLIELALRDRLELVVVALRALNRQAQQRRRKNLLRPFEREVAVDHDLFRIAVTLARTVRAIAEEVRRFEQVDHLWRRVPFVLLRIEAAEFVAGDLLANELVERLVGVQRTNHVIAIAVRQRPIRVGIEIAVRVGIAGDIQPPFAPPLAVRR